MLAWNYIGIIELASNSSSVNVYRYQEQRSQLPKIVAEKPLHQAQGTIGNHTHDEVIAPLMKHVSSMVPKPQWFRTPVFLYGDSSVDADSLRGYWDSVRESDSFLFGNSKVVDEHQRAALTWAANYAERGGFDDLQKGDEADHFAALELSSMNVRLAYRHKKKSRPTNQTIEELKLGLRTSNDHIKTELNTVNYALRDLLHRDELDSCIPAKGGSYRQCQVALNRVTHMISASVPDEDKLVLVGFDSWVNKANSEAQEVAAVCEDDKTDATYSCLEYVTAEKLAHLAEKQDREVDYSSYSWTEGRALIFADIEQSSDKAKIGIKGESDKHWDFGVKETISRPGTPGQDKSSITQSHRLLGSLFLLVALGIIVYLLIGATGRQKVWDAVVHKRNWSKLRREEMQVELDDLEVDDEEELVDGELPFDDRYEV